MKRTLIAVAAVGLLALPACGGSDSETPMPTDTGTGAGLANPASARASRSGSTTAR